MSSKKDSLYCRFLLGVGKIGWTACPCQSSVSSSEGRVDLEDRLPLSFDLLFVLLRVVFFSRSKGPRVEDRVSLSFLPSRLRIEGQRVSLLSAHVTELY